MATAQKNPAIEARQLPGELADRHFEALRALALAKTGISLDDSKRTLLHARFSRRLRALRMTDFGAYIAEVQRPGSPELAEFINTVTTNLTYFFREEHHFRYLQDEVLPLLQSSRRAGDQMLRIWSAGCSSGEEPYSIAITLAECGLEGGRHFRLLATDLDTEMVARTQAGSFQRQTVRGLSAAREKEWFIADDQVLLADSRLKQGMLARQLNLFDSWPLRNPVDIIFCRNVLIYFTRDYQARIIRKFAEHQRPGGALFLGHSESIKGLDDLYQRLNNTVYRRK